MRTQAGTQKLIIQQENNTNENKENHISQSVDGISYQKQRNKLRKVNDNIQKCQQHLQNLKKNRSSKLK